MYVHAMSIAYTLQTFVAMINASPSMIVGVESLENDRLAGFLKNYCVAKLHQVREKVCCQPIAFMAKFAYVVEGIDMWYNEVTTQAIQQK